MTKQFTNAEIQNCYNVHVKKTKEYYTKWSHVHTLLSPEDKKYWKGKDVPRLFSILDFKEYIHKHNIQKGNHLFYTSTDDPELKYLNYDHMDLFAYNESTPNDLHTTLTNKQDYDLVLFNQTLEHLYNPFLAMTKLFDVLRPGGHLYTTVPIVNIPHLRPYHFWGITPNGLCLLMLSVGFEIKECGYWGNHKYMEHLFKDKYWPDYTQVAERNGTIINEDHCQAQTWVLVHKPE
jgi:SAM-dependent methyltransferase